jgi:hypothetical protein
MLRIPRLTGSDPIGQAPRRAVPIEPDTATVPVMGGGQSYSVRICGRCRKPVERGTSGGYRCSACGRTRGWI